MLLVNYRMHNVICTVFFTGFGSRCFMCGVVISEWKDRFDVPTRHLQYSPYCIYAKYIAAKTKSDTPDTNTAE
jgi:hypothetical protein